MKNNINKNANRSRHFDPGGLSSIEELSDYAYSCYMSDINSFESYKNQLLNYYNVKKTKIFKNKSNFKKSTSFPNNSQHTNTKINLNKRIQNPNVVVQKEKSEDQKYSFNGRDDARIVADSSKDGRNTTSEASCDGIHSETPIRKREVGRLKKRFKHNSGIQRPFYSNSFSSRIASCFPNSVPIFVDANSTHSVESSDDETFRAYCRGSKTISRDLFSLWVRSAYAAFYNLGLPISLGKSDEELVRPISLDTVFENIAKNTNSGSPFNGRKNDPEIITKTRTWVESFLKDPKHYTLMKGSINENLSSLTDLDTIFSMPTHIYHRLQISPEKELSNRFNTKIRQVWCVPYCVVALESYFFSGQIDLMMQNASVNKTAIFPIGLSNRELSQMTIDDVNRKRKRFLISKTNRKMLKSLDYSKFDRNIQNFFTCIYFCLWRTFLKLTPEESKAYSILRMYTCYCPFIYKDELRITERGVCSGSYTTNARDTFVNMCLICISLIVYQNYYEVVQDIILQNLSLSDVSKRINSELKGLIIFPEVYCVKLYGDDGVLIEEPRFFLLLEQIARENSLTCNFKDTLSDGSFFFLGRFWDLTNKPWQTYAYMAAHILFRSKWYKKEEVNFDISKDLELFRILSICMPLRDGKHFVESVFGDWDKYVDFKKSRRGFYYLKEYPSSEYAFIPGNRVGDLFVY